MSLLLLVLLSACAIGSETEEAKVQSLQIGNVGDCYQSMIIVGTEDFQGKIELPGCKKTKSLDLILNLDGRYRIPVVNADGNAAELDIFIEKDLRGKYPPFLVIAKNKKMVFKRRLRKVKIVRRRRGAALLVTMFRATGQIITGTPYRLRYVGTLGDMLRIAN